MYGWKKYIIQFGYAMIDFHWNISSSRPSDAYMRQYIRPSLVRIIACRPFATKPLSEPMQIYCQFDSKENIWKKFYLKFKSFHSGEYIWKYGLKMATMLSQPKYVDVFWIQCQIRIYRFLSVFARQNRFVLHHVKIRSIYTMYSHRQIHIVTKTLATKLETIIPTEIQTNK